MSAYLKMHAFVQGKRDKSLERLSRQMWDMLWQANEYGSAPYDVYRLSTRRALEGKGLLSGWKLTEAGRRAILVEWREPALDLARRHAEGVRTNE